MSAKLVSLSLLVLLLLLGDVQIHSFLQLSLRFTLEVSHPVAEEDAHVSEQVRLRLLRGWNKLAIQIGLDEGSVGRVDSLGVDAGESSFLRIRLLATLTIFRHLFAVDHTCQRQHE